MSQLPNDQKEEENFQDNIDENDAEFFYDKQPTTRSDNTANTFEDDVLFVRRHSGKSDKAYNINELSTFGNNNNNKGGRVHHQKEETGMNLWDSQSQVGGSSIVGGSNDARSVVSPPMSIAEEGMHENSQVTYHTYQTGGQSYHSGSETPLGSDVTGNLTTIVRNDETLSNNDGQMDDIDNFDNSNNGNSSYNNDENFNALQQPQRLKMVDSGTMVVHSDKDTDEGGNDGESENTSNYNDNINTNINTNTKTNTNTNVKFSKHSKSSKKSKAALRAKSSKASKSTHPMSSMISELSKGISNRALTANKNNNGSSNNNNNSNKNGHMAQLPSLAHNSNNNNMNQNRNVNSSSPMPHSGLNVVDDSGMDIASYGTVKSTLMTSILDDTVAPLSRPQSALTPTHVTGDNNNTFDSAQMGNLEEVYVQAMLEKQQMTDTDPDQDIHNRHNNRQKNQSRSMPATSKAETDEYALAHSKFPYPDTDVNLYDGGSRRPLYQKISSTVANSPQTPQLLKGLSDDQHMTGNRGRGGHPRDGGQSVHVGTQKSRKSRKSGRDNDSKNSLHYSGSDEGIDSEVSSLSRDLNSNNNKNSKIKQRRLSALTSENLAKMQMNDHGNGIYSDIEFVRHAQQQMQQQHHVQFQQQQYGHHQMAMMSPPMNGMNMNMNTMYNNNTNNNNNNYTGNGNMTGMNAMNVHMMNGNDPFSRRDNNTNNNRFDTYDSHTVQSGKTGKSYKKNRRNNGSNGRDGRNTHSAGATLRARVHMPANINVTGGIGMGQQSMGKTNQPVSVTSSNASSEERRRRKLMTRRYEHNHGDYRDYRDRDHRAGSIESRSRSPGLASVSEEDDHGWHGGARSASRGARSGDRSLSGGGLSKQLSYDVTQRERSKTDEEKQKEIIKYVAIGAAVFVIVVGVVVVGRKWFSKQSGGYGSRSSAYRGTRIRRAPRRYH